MTVQGTRQAWQKVKGAYAYAGGYEEYLTDIGMLMIQGEVEGTVGEKALGQDWWRRACVKSAQQLGVEVGAHTHGPQEGEEMLVVEGDAAEGSSTEEWEWEEE